MSYTQHAKRRGLLPFIGISIGEIERIVKWQGENFNLFIEFYTNKYEGVNYNE